MHPNILSGYFNTFLLLTLQKDDKLGKVTLGQRPIPMVRIYYMGLHNRFCKKKLKFKRRDNPYVYSPLIHLLPIQSAAAKFQIFYSFSKKKHLKDEIKSMDDLFS